MRTFAKVLAIVLGTGCVTVMACSSGSTKADCTRDGQPVDCSVLDSPTDGGAKTDTGAQGDTGAAGVCSKANGGLFSVQPPCSDAMQINVNGSMKYVCRCTSPCPCGLACGEVPYPPPVIGVIPNVCSSSPTAQKDAGDLAVCPSSRALTVPSTVNGDEQNLPLVYDVTLPAGGGIIVTASSARSYFTPTLDLVTSCDPASAVMAKGVAVSGALKTTAIAKVTGAPGSHVFARVGVDPVQMATPDTFKLTTQIAAVNAFCASATVVTAGQTLKGEDSSKAADTLAGRGGSCYGAGTVMAALRYYKVHVPAGKTLSVDVGGAASDVTLVVQSACNATACLKSASGSQLFFTNGNADADLIVAAGISNPGASPGDSLTYDITFNVM